MTDTDNIQGSADTAVNAEGKKSQQARRRPLRSRQKDSKTGKPEKASRGTNPPVESEPSGFGRANLYVQAKARPTGVFAAWTCVGLLAIGATLGAASFLAPKPQPVVQQTGVSPKQQRAGAEATGFVSAWLSATSTNSDALNRYLGNKPASIASRNPVEARNLSAASIETASNGSLVVTVSGEVKTNPAATAAGKETPAATASAVPSASAGWVQRWWTVALSEQAGGFAVLGLPSPVAGPGQGSAPSLAYQYAASPELTKAITDFLAAYAAGIGDVSRYVSPGSGIGAITPAPYTEVRVRSVNTVDEVAGGAPKDRTEARALVVVDLVVGDVQQQSQYALKLTARGGQWEVSTVDPAPVLTQKK